MDQWAEVAPPRPQYRYPPSLSPHLFMGLRKFDTARLHQARAGTSYLADQRPNPGGHEPDPLCPRCRKAPESFHYAVIECDARSAQRLKQIPSLLSVAAESDVWTSEMGIIGLANNMLSTATNFPPGAHMPSLLYHPSPDNPPPSGHPSPRPSHLLPSNPPSWLLPEISLALPPRFPFLVFSVDFGWFWLLSLVGSE